MPRWLCALGVREQAEWQRLSFFLLIFFLVGAGLALGRGSAEALFFKRYGIQFLPVMFIVLALLLSLLSTVYAAYADRVPAERFFVVLFLLLAGLLLANRVAMSMPGMESAYPVYFLIYEVASELLMMHGLFYLGQNFETLQVKRFTALAFAAMQIGKISGGLLLVAVVHRFGAPNMLYLWTALCIAGAVLITLRHRRLGVSPWFQPGRRGRKRLGQALEQISQGFAFARRSSLIRATSMSLFFLVIAFYIMCYTVNRIYAKSFTTEESLTQFFGLLAAGTGTLALLIQLLVTGRLLSRFGIKKTNLIFPLTGLASFVFLIVSFSLPAAIVGSINKDALMPAIRNPTRNLFFSALPDYMQGRARAMQLIVVLPLALAITGGFLYVVQRSPNPALFLWAGLAACLAYLACNFAMNRAYVSSILSVVRDRVFMPGRQLQNVIRGSQAELFEELMRGVQHDDPDICVAYSRSLLEANAGRAMPVIVQRMRSSDTVLRNRLLHLVRHHGTDVLDTYLLEAAETGDAHLRALALGRLFARKNEQARTKLGELLRSNNPRLMAAAVIGVPQYDDAHLMQQADRCWQRLLEGSNEGALIAVLEVMLAVPARRDEAFVLGVLQQQDSPRIQRAVVALLSRWLPPLPPAFVQPLIQLAHSEDYEIRRRAVECHSVLEPEQARKLLFVALEDPHPKVRDAAIAALSADGVERSQQLSQWIVENRGTPRSQEGALLALLAMSASQELFRSIADTKIQDARWCQRAATLLPQDDAEALNWQPLRLALLERTQQYADLVLMAMGRFDDSVAIDVIRAGLKSGDARQVSNACEAVRHVRSRRLGEYLGNLLEGTGKTADIALASAQDVLSWCRQQDPWIRDCARYAAGG